MRRASLSIQPGAYPRDSHVTAPQPTALSRGQQRSNVLPMGNPLPHNTGTDMGHGQGRDSGCDRVGSTPKIPRVGHKLPPWAPRGPVGPIGPQGARVPEAPRGPYHRQYQASLISTGSYFFRGIWHFLSYRARQAPPRLCRPVYGANRGWTPDHELNL